MSKFDVFQIWKERMLTDKELRESYNKRELFDFRNIKDLYIKSSRARIFKNTIKCMVIGNGSVGKTTFLMKLLNMQRDPNYTPRSIEGGSRFVALDRQPHCLQFYDTDEYDRLNFIARQMTQVYLLCYAVNDSSSVDSIEDKHKHEIRHYSPKARFILLGLKADLRKDVNYVGFKVDYNHMVSLSLRLKASYFCELSSLDESSNFEDLFEKIARIHIEGEIEEERKKSHCHLF